MQVIEVGGVSADVLDVEAVGRLPGQLRRDLVVALQLGVIRAVAAEAADIDVTRIVVALGGVQCRERGLQESVRRAWGQTARTERDVAVSTSRVERPIGVLVT